MPLSLEWIAGFFDGEGHVSIGMQKHYKTGKLYGRKNILLGQSGPEGLAILKEVQTMCGGQLYLHMKAGEGKATKDAWKLYWRAKEGRKFLEQITPYLRLKQKAALEALEYIKRNDAT